jgi:hypothetical protein
MVIAQFDGLDHAFHSLLAYGAQAEVLAPESYASGSRPRRPTLLPFTWPAPHTTNCHELPLGSIEAPPREGSSLSETTAPDSRARPFYAPPPSWAASRSLLGVLLAVDGVRGV